MTTTIYLSFSCHVWLVQGSKLIFVIMATKEATIPLQWIRIPPTLARLFKATMDYQSCGQKIQKVSDAGQYIITMYLWPDRYWNVGVILIRGPQWPQRSCQGGWHIPHSFSNTEHPMKQLWRGILPEKRWWWVPLSSYMCTSPVCYWTTGTPRTS